MRRAKSFANQKIQFDFGQNDKATLQNEESQQEKSSKTSENEEISKVVETSSSSEGEEKCLSQNEHQKSTESVNSHCFDNNLETSVPAATARDEPQFTKLDEKYQISKVPLTQRIIFNDKYDNDNSFSQDKIECSFENYHHQHRLVKREHIQGSSSRVNWSCPDVQEGDDCEKTRNLLKLLKPTKKDVSLVFLPQKGDQTTFMTDLIDK